MRALVVVAALLLTVPVVLAQGASGPMLVPNWGTEVPALALEPVASDVTHEDNLYVWGGGTRWSDTSAPTEAWNRVFLTVHSYPVPDTGDPWDRLVEVYVGPVGMEAEVLRFTTIRGDMTLTEDITEYASLMTGDFRVGIRSASWAETGFFADARLDYYADPAGAIIAEDAADMVAAPFRASGFGGPGHTKTVTYDFGDMAPESGVIEFFTSGHAAEGEFWYQYDPITPPRFQIYVDGQHAGLVEAQPYIYALLGFCCGTQSQIINQALWTAPFLAGEATDFQYVTGEIPSYRANIPDHILALLEGERDVTIVKETHGGHWPSSLNFLLDW